MPAGAVLAPWEGFGACGVAGNGLRVAYDFRVEFRGSRTASCRTRDRQERQIVLPNQWLDGFLAVIRGFGSLRYQQADEVQLRKALESRHKVRA